MQGFRLRLVLGLVVGAIAVSVGPASASAGTRSASFVLPANGAVGTTTAKCPSGRRATGGGFQTSPPGFINILVYESRKVGQRSWRVSAVESGVGSGPTAVTGFVSCSRDAPKTEAGSVTMLVLPGGISSADADCASGTKAQAGGFLTNVPDFVTSAALLVDSFRSGKRTWRSRAQQVSGSPTITSYVYCADAKKPAARTGSVTSSMGNVTALSAECKHGTKVASGGFSQSATAPADAYRWPYESFRTGRRWQASAQHAPAPNSVALTSIAYCV
jgi:hypothetical protein